MNTCYCLRECEGSEPTAVYKGEFANTFQCVWKFEGGEPTTDSERVSANSLNSSRHDDIFNFAFLHGPVTVLPSIFKKEIFTPIALNCANLMPKALLRTETPRSSTRNDPNGFSLHHYFYPRASYEYFSKKKKIKHVAALLMAEDLRLSEWFPNAPPECRKEALTFFDCFHQKSKPVPGKRVCLAAAISPIG